MKTLTLILSLLSASIALAEEPAELVKLRQAWQAQRTEAQGKVAKLFFAQLEQLKKNFVQAGNIADALVVDNVIKGGKKANNEPKTLTKLREANSKSLKKALTPLDKKYWQDLKKLKQEYQANGNLNGVLVADAEIKKVLAAHKKPKAPLKPSKNLDVMAKISVVGEYWDLKAGAPMYTNRTYRWAQVPKDFSDWEILKRSGGPPANLKFTIMTPGWVYLVSVGHDTGPLIENGWQTIAGCTGTGWKGKVGAKGAFKVMKKWLDVGEHNVFSTEFFKTSLIRPKAEQK